MADIVRLVVTALVCGVILVFGMDIWALGFLVLSIASLPFGIRAIWKLAKGRKHSALISAIRCAMLLGTAIGMVILAGANDSLAQKNAQTVVSAVERYKAERGDFPNVLNDLVPAYMTEVPTYRQGLWPVPFFYRKSPARLSYEQSFRIIHSYLFESRTWEQMD